MSLIQHYRDLLQLGYVTKDLDRATAFFERKLGAGAFAVSDYELTADFGGRMRDYAMRVALAWAGDHQIEIIQPVSGAVEFYRDGIDFDRHVVALHHIGIAVEGPLAAWDEMVENVRASGDDFTVLFAADPSPDFGVRFGYVDTRAHYGHFTEYLWWSPGVKAGNAHLPDLTLRQR